MSLDRIRDELDVLLSTTERCMWTREESEWYRKLTNREESLLTLRRRSSPL